MNLQDLHEYQKRLANFIARHPNCIISVDMGLGKTNANPCEVVLDTQKIKDALGI